MKKLISLLALVVSINGCAATSAWWDRFQQDPAAQVAALENVVHTVVSTALVVFGQVKPTLPVDVQAQVQARIDQAVSAINHSLTALNDAVQIAVYAKSDNPDLSKIINDLIDAANNLVAIVDEFKTRALTATVSGNSYNDMRTAQQTLDRYRRK